MAAASIQDITDFQQVIRLLEEHPEWRADLRRVLLTDDLLDLPRHVARLTDQVALLTERVTTLANGQQRLITDVGALKGRDLERTYREKAAVFFDEVVQEPQALSFSDVRSLLDNAVRQGLLSAGERREISRADLIVQGRHPQTGEALYLVVEVSWGVRSDDVERAAKRAALLRKLGAPVLAVVAGEGILPEAHADAVAQGVWQVIDGTALSPAS